MDLNKEPNENEQQYIWRLCTAKEDGVLDLDWKSLSILGKSKGFEWGGDWKFKDMPHFENMFGNSLKVLRKLPKDKKGLPILKQ